MHKYLLLLCLTIAHVSNSFGQTQKSQVSATYDYYICLSGMTARADIEKIENTIQKKEGISFFQGDRTPVRFFTLKSTKPLTREEFSTWLDSKYKIEFYGEGIEGKERAIMTYKKLNQTSLKN